MSDRLPRHVPVMCDEVIQWLQPRPGQILVDGTLGGGGHTFRLSAEVSPGGRIIGLDRDSVAIASAERRLRGQSVELIQSNYCNLPEVLGQVGVCRTDGILLDLGISSDQLADDQRGFSFNSQGLLDLRFDAQQGEPAWRLLKRLSAKHLADILYNYGEERYSRRIAKRIVEYRQRDPIRTSVDLADLVRSCVPKTRDARRIDPATRTFQALRIAVNAELKSLEIALRRMPDCVRPGARLAIISYHSLEDRRVKEAFRDDNRYEVLTRRPVRAGAEELAQNPRSRSAKLRVAQRTDQMPQGGG